MKLLETDWNAKGGPAPIEVEYPDRLIQDFVNWVRTNRAWPENPESMERRVRKLNQALADHRNQAAVAPPPSPVVERLRKARAAKAAKRAKEAESHAG